MHLYDFTNKSKIDNCIYFAEIWCSDTIWHHNYTMTSFSKQIHLPWKLDGTSVDLKMMFYDCLTSLSHPAKTYLIIFYSNSKIFTHYIIVCYIHKYIIYTCYCIFITYYIQSNQRKEQCISSSLKEEQWPKKLSEIGKELMLTKSSEVWKCKLDQTSAILKGT